MNIIGNKDSFAIQYKITDARQLLGYGKLWIQNTFFGTSEDLIYLNGDLVSLIEDILDAHQYDSNYVELDSEKLFRALEHESLKTSKYLIRSSTFTDDFIGYKFKCKSEIILVWKIINGSEVVFEDLKNYPTSVMLVKLNIDEGQIVLDELKSVIG